jgi:hypothetical protein
VRDDAGLEHLYTINQQVGGKAGKSEVGSRGKLVQAQGASTTWEMMRCLI